MYILVSTSYRCFISNLALIGMAVSEKMFEYHGNIHIYCPGVAVDKPNGSFFSES